VFGRLLFGSFKARRARVALGLTAVALGAGMATALATLALRVGDDVALALRAAGPNFLIQPRGDSWTPDLGGADLLAGRALAGLSDSAVAELKQCFWKHNILQAAPELTLSGRVGGEPASVVGTWFERSIPTEDGPWTTGVAALRPTWKVAGRWPGEDSEELALGATLARAIGAAPGESVRVELPRGARRLVVSGVVSVGGPEDAQAWIPLRLAQTLAERPGRADRVWMSALLRPGRSEPPPDEKRDPKGYERYMCTAYPEVVAADVASLIPGVEVLPATERIAGEAHIVLRLTLLMVLLTGAALTASTLGLLSTTTATVVERSTELALLRAIGASPRQLAALLLGETALVSLFGGLLGWGLGSFTAALIRGGGLAGAGTFQPVLLPVSLAIAALVGGLGTLAPLRIALRLDPAQVLRG
jgi:putative ABC transport system permease protein